MTYILATAFVKISIAWMLLRIEVRNKFRRTIIAGAVIFCIFSLAVFFIGVFQCRPLSVAWGVGEGTCVALEIFGLGMLVLSIVDVLTNWLYSLLPIAMFWHVQMARNQKASLVLMLSIGIV
jgi:hypothetical protein